MQNKGLLSVRLIVAGLLALLALNDFFATALTIAYRSGALGVAERLGRLTPGDDFRRLIPLMDAVPVWLHALWVLAGISYLLAAVICLVRRRGAAPLLVIMAVGLGAIAELAGRPVIAAAGVVVNPHPSVIAAVVLPYLMPLGLALALWWVGRQNTNAVAPAS
jgi:hypothetical protein